MSNPFVIKEIQPDEPFCDRTIELKELVSHGESFVNVVLYSHRRFGKTSLAKRVQNLLESKGIITVYTDFFGLVTIDEVAERLIQCLYTYCYKNENLFQKTMRAIKNWRPILKPDPERGIEITVEQTTRESGLALLEETFKLFGDFAKEQKTGFNIVLDEFQEISNLQNAIKIEGILRSQIQSQRNVGYFFVGSQRRMLIDIFNESKRPFYKSSINYALGILPKADAVSFIVERFQAGGKKCGEDVAGAIYDSAHGFPYYVQRIPFEIYVHSDNEIVTEQDHQAALRSILKTDSSYFECIVSSLSTVQKQVIYALAKEPVEKPLNPKYMSRHRLSSPGSALPALKKLLALDLVEKQEEDGKYHVVDPFFAAWLAGKALNGV